MPFYLRSDYNKKGSLIRHGEIFFRDKDSDFGKNNAPTYAIAESLWKKHFHLDLTAKERFYFILDDIDNWSWRDGEPEKFVYDRDPNFCIEIEEKKNQETYNQVESFSVNLQDPQISWSSVSLKYNQQDVMNPLTGMYLDDYMGFAVYPEISKLKDLSYYYYFANSLREKVGNVVNYQKRHATGTVTIDNYFNSIVQYSDDKQRQLIESEIESKKIDFSPKAEEVKQLNELLKTRFGKEYVERHTFSYMISQIKLTRYINKTINK
ncbi:hypothetical protein FAM18119_02902 [Lacticaseibacillus paracasei]|nr:hypothetical protein FAM18119_02902 [Lacticaseibacillus paracasei]